MLFLNFQHLKAMAKVSCLTWHGVDASLAARRIDHVPSGGPHAFNLLQPAPTAHKDRFSITWHVNVTYRNITSKWLWVLLHSSCQLSARNIFEKGTDQDLGSRSCSFINRDLFDFDHVCIASLPCRLRWPPSRREDHRVGCPPTSPAVSRAAVLQASAVPSLPRRPPRRPPRRHGCWRLDFGPPGYNRLLTGYNPQKIWPQKIMAFECGTWWSTILLGPSFRRTHMWQHQFRMLSTRQCKIYSTMQ